MAIKTWLFLSALLWLNLPGVLQAQISAEEAQKRMEARQAERVAHAESRPTSQPTQTSNQELPDSSSEGDKVNLERYRAETLAEIAREIKQTQTEMKTLRLGSAERTEAANQFRSLKEELAQFKTTDLAELRIRLVYEWTGYDGEVDRLMAQADRELQMTMQYMRAGDVRNQNAMSVAAERDARVAGARNKRLAHLFDFVKAMDQEPIRAAAQFILEHRKLQSEEMRQHLMEWAKE